MHLASLVPEELTVWAVWPPSLCWSGEEAGKRIGNPSAAGAREAVPVASTASEMLPLRRPQWRKQSPSEQTKEKKIPRVAQQPGRRVTSRTLSTEITAGIDNMNKVTKQKRNTKETQLEI